MSAFLRKYGQGTGADVYIPMIKAGATDFAVSADWTPAAGDVKVSKDGAAAANIGTLPSAVTMGNTAMWKFVFTNAELECKSLAVFVADAATKAVEDQAFAVETYGNASALHPFDLGTASTAQTGDTYALANGANGFVAIKTDTAAVLLDTGTDGVVVNAAGLATDAVNEIRNAITGGAYALDTDANGRMRVVDGTAAGEIALTAGLIDGIAGTISTLDALDTAQDSQHSTTQSAISALNDLDSTAVQSAANAALVALHLDHLLAVAYDPASKPGAVDALFNELVENDAGVSRFTTNALEQVWSAATRILTAGTNIALAKGVGVTGFNDLDASGIRSAVGLAAANLDTQLAALPTQAEITGGAYALDTDANGRVRIVDGTGIGELDTASGTVSLSAATEAQIDAIEGDTNELQTDWANGGRLDLLLDGVLEDTGTTLPASIAALNDLGASDILASQLTESYAANGVAPTLTQAIFAIHQKLMDRAVSGTSETVRRLDGSTTAFVCTMNDDTNPTAITRAAA